MNTGRVEDTKVSFSCPIISNSGRFKKLWDLIVNLCLLFSFITVPFTIAIGRQNGQPTLRHYDLAVDVILVIDIVLSFFTDNYSHSSAGLTCLEISNRYIKGTFLFDVFGTMPGLILLENYSNKQSYYFLKLFRLCRAH